MPECLAIAERSESRNARARCHRDEPSRDFRRMSRSGHEKTRQLRLVWDDIFAELRIQKLPRKL